MSKAVFLDRDGTINADEGYLYRKEDFIFLPGVFEGLRQLQEAGYLLIIVTNQSGIARGYYTEEDFSRLNAWMLSRFEDEGIHITEVYYCPHHPEAVIEKYRVECNCRKPKTGLFREAEQKYGIEPGLSFVIGDKLRDCALCDGSGYRGFLVGELERPEIIQKVRQNAYPDIYYADDLPAAAQDILRITGRR